MRIFKYCSFHRWAKAEGLSNIVLRKAVFEIIDGLFTTNLGGGLYKKRIAKKGQGKRGGYRMIIAFERKNMAVFMYGFAKNERDNMTDKEKLVYKKLAKYFLNLTDTQLSLLIDAGELIEVKE